MPKVTYLGPHDEITFPDHGITVARGDSVDVSDALAGELVARENGTSWELVAPATKGRAAADKES